LREVLPTIERGTVVVGILGVPFKCPPAPHECLFLLHDYLADRGVREKVDLRLASPMPSPIPVSPTASQAILDAYDKRGISYEFGHRPEAGSGEDYFFASPLHKAPDVVQASGLTEGGADGWIHVDPRNLRTPYDGVY